jgi:hypothetical protein
MGLPLKILMQVTEAILRLTLWQHTVAAEVLVIQMAALEAVFLEGLIFINPVFLTAQPQQQKT